ncbi:hypothetical protein L615_004100000270 [Nocardioides sp. J9]|uniref:hypothetical protein n=1 Tax=unclassified Nocardioides TaxID=2615069 RepID=UPI00119D8F82|nr:MULTISPECIES: hypothetical protein [unclassified Nocardioides]TWG96770.1 hypothetical protein L615_004100000270 [Nocardioides sp. J9]
MMSAWRTTAVVVCFLAWVLAVASGCSLVGQPDVAAWDQKARQAVTDAASEVATARLAVETARDDRTWSSYTTVVVAQAEEAMGTVQDDVSRLQVPPGRAQDADDLEALLDAASSAVQDARQHAVAGEHDDRDLLDRLDRVGERLTRAETRW